MSADTTRRYIVAYDIADDRRRIHVANFLSSFGDRVQYSVFVCDLKPARFARLRSSLLSLIFLSEDSIMICDLGQTRSLDVSQFEIIGTSRPVTPTTVLIA